jgi:2-polyprenyl-3-methyl-5-hydroxy-6-metoxy-1,4-benzoquinol methylase
MTDVKKCPACGSHAFKPFLNCIDHSISKELFNLITCDSCSLVITSPRPDDAALEKYYLSQSYISHTSKSTSLIDFLYLASRKFTLRKKVKLISKYSGPTKSILDYGCGTGHFLQACKSDSWIISGIEPSDLARTKASELLQTQVKKSIGEQTKKFEVITLWHVLEHIPEPDKIIEELKSRLTENGTIFIAVPNTKCYDAEKYKSTWAAYDVPRHLWHFNPGNMQALLSRLKMKITAIHPMKLDAYYVSMLSEKYRAKNKIKLTGLIKAFLNGTISNAKARRTGNYSSLIYVVQK